MLISDIYNIHKDNYSEKGKHNFPVREKIDPKEKVKSEYCIKNAEAIFTSLINGETCFTINDYKRIQDLREYAEGNQSIWNYLIAAGLTSEVTPPTGHTVTTYDGDWTQSTKNKRKGFGHINTKIVSIAPKIVNMFRGLFAAYEEDIFVNNVDEDSGAEEERKMYEAFLLAREGKWIDEKRKNAGIETGESNGVFPSDVSLDELQSFYDSGGFKLDYARIMEKLLRYTQNVSNWKQIKDEFTKDLVTLFFICGRSYYDAETDEEKWGYLDPATFVIQRSKELNYDNADYGGYFMLEKVSTLIAKGFDSAELKPIAKRYVDVFGNPDGSLWDTCEKNPPNDNWYYGYKIPVFVCAWIDTDIKKELDYTNVYGKRSVIDLAFDEKVKPLTAKQKAKGASQEKRETRALRVYQCNWVVGTNMAYEYGLAPCQIRKGKKGVKIPFFAEKGMTSTGIFGSIMESITPFLDQIQITWYQLQDLHARMVKSGWMINLRLISNLKLGGKIMEVEDVFEKLKTTGLLPYMDTMIGDFYRGGEVQPLHRIEGGMGQEFVELLQLIKVNYDLISEFTGISPVKLGAVPGADQPVTTTEMSVMATNQISRPLIELMFSLKEKFATSSSKRIQILVKSNKGAEKTYRRVVGARDIDVLRDAANLGVEYGTSLEARPDDKEKDELIAAAQAALQRGRDGEALIDFSHYTYIIEQARGDGNLKELRWRFSLIEQRAKQIEQQKKQANIMLQAQEQDKTEEKKKKYEMEMEKMKLEGEIMKSNNEARNDLMLKKAEENMEFLKILQQQLIAEQNETQSIG